MTDPRFHLDVTTDPDDAIVRLHLRDADGRHKGAHAVRLAEHRRALLDHPATEKSRTMLSADSHHTQTC